MENKLIIFISVITGLILNILLGFIPNSMGSLIGSQKWGYLFYWLSQAIYPGAPIEVLWLNLIINCIFWIFTFFLIIKLIDFLIIR
jgi:hypothetical protein